MGCCFSAGKHRPEATERGSSIDGAPPISPPVVFEEEAVKEVLMETPIVSKNEDRVPPMPPPPNREIESAIQGNSAELKKENDEIAPEVSEISEICSYSDSLSNATAQGKKGDDEDDGVVNQRPPPRKRRAHGGGRGRGARRVAAPPPEKKFQVAPLRPVSGRSVVAQPRNVAEEKGGKRDSGYDPVKRSRSRSPVRIWEAEARRNAGDEKIPVPATAEFRNGVVSAEEAETLENPVVSLECFIFL